MASRTCPSCRTRSSAGRTCLLAAALAAAACGCSSYRGNADAVADDASDMGIDSPADASNDSGRPSIRDFSVALNHACAVGAYGETWCWGANDHGQIGMPPSASPSCNTSAIATPCASLPVRVAGFTATSIAAGGGHTCATDGSGSVFCWGDNAFGDLGLSGSLSDSSSPAMVYGLADVISLGAGIEDTCALTAGAAKCWGRGDVGQLGSGMAGVVPFRSPPSDDVAFPSGGQVASIAVGHSHACARLADGGVYCWGSNDHGQLGIGDVTLPMCANPDAGATDVVLEGADVVVNEYNGTPCAAAPMPVMLDPTTPLHDALAIAVGHEFTCAVRSDGTVWCWGYNNAGQLGDGTAIDSRSPVQVAHLIDIGIRAVSIAAGSLHACVIDGAAHVWCWGANDRGQLGTAPSVANALGEIHEVEPFVDAAIIHAGDKSTCALRADGSLWCWGANAMGQLGNGMTTDSSSPVLVAVQ